MTRFKHHCAIKIFVNYPHKARDKSETSGQPAVLEGTSPGGYILNQPRSHIHTSNGFWLGSVDLVCRWRLLSILTCAQFMRGNLRLLRSDVSSYKCLSCRAVAVMFSSGILAEGFYA